MRMVRCSRACIASCELTILHKVASPVIFGVGTESADQQQPDFLEKPGTVLIQRELLVEELNPGPNLPAKVVGFGCVLAHEMAHHALRHEWGAAERFSDVSELPVVRRRWVLDMLEAGKLAALTGLPYEVLVDHWGIADEHMRSNLLEYTAAKSDARTIRADDDARIEHRDVAGESRLHVAEEWVLPS